MDLNAYCVKKDGKEIELTAKEFEILKCRKLEDISGSDSDEKVMVFTDVPDGTLDAAPGMDAISSPIELFTGMAFLIFTSVMLASQMMAVYF